MFIFLTIASYHQYENMRRVGDLRIKLVKASDFKLTREYDINFIRHENHDHREPVSLIARLISERCAPS